MLKYFLHFWMFAFTMFAAADVSLGGGGGSGDGADSSGDASGDSGEGAAESSDGTGTSGSDGLSDAEVGDLREGEQQDDQRQQQERPEDKETADLKGLVSKRLLALKNETKGELTAVLAKYPKAQEQIEAAFRRDMAYRELYPTVAEARQMREQFPNGMADVEQFMTELGEVEQLDQNFYGRDAQGNYGGHATLIQNLFQDDRAAAVSLFKTVPKEWARLDPDSYNEVMGQVVGATLQRSEIPEWLTELRDAAKEAKQDGLAASLDKMLRWSQGFLKRKAEPSEEERRLSSQREQFRRETEERSKQDLTRSQSTFFSESQKQQQSIVRKHSAVAEMLQTKAIPEAKKAEIVAKIQTKIRDFVKTTRGFKKFRDAYHGGNVQEALKLEKAMWSYPWVLNKFVRAVLAEETPNLVRQNRERTRGAAAQSQRPPANRGQQQENKRTGPYQEGTVWKKADGTRFTTAEILRGLHLK